MSTEHVDVLVVGGGQAGLAMSEHLSNRGVPHLVLERDFAVKTITRLASGSDRIAASRLWTRSSTFLSLICTPC